MRALTAILLAGALSAGLSPRAFAQASPADSTLDAFMRALSDSTDDYFGLAAQRPDTAGLDSALAWGLANPGREGGRRRGRLTLAPAYGFNRVDGHRPGIGAALGRESGTGRVSGTLQYALESEQLMGGAQFVKRWRASDRLHAWVATLGGGRSSEAFDRDFFDPVFSTLNGALYGADRHDYVQRDGVRLSLVREAPRWNASVQLRDQLESPQPARTTWNLFGNELSAPANAPAAFGRVRELELAAHTELPFVPFSAEVQHATSGDALGSDLTYRRWRAAVGGVISMTRHVALVTQAQYGRLHVGDAPQAAFMLGGAPTLRSLDRNARRGTGVAVAKADLILTDDLLRLLGLRGVSVLPLQLGAFANTGAAWGRDAATGVARLTRADWPERADWLTEAGVSLLYRPGVPDPSTTIRFDFVIPIGDDAREPGFFAAYQRPLNFLRRPPSRD